MKKLSIICCLTAMTTLGCQTAKPPLAAPKYAADIPEIIQTPDIVETEHLG